MAVKIIGLCLMFSYLSLCVKAKTYIDVTESEFENMQGKDIAASCGNKAGLEDICSHLRKLRNLAEDNVPFASGYPKCHESSMQVKKKDGSGILLKKVKFVICSWDPCAEYWYARGRCANSVMSFDCNPASCLPFAEFQYA